MAKSVSQIPGVVSSDLNFASGILLIEFDPAVDPRQAAASVVRKAGHGIEPLEVRGEEEAAAFLLEERGCSDCAAEVREVLGSLPGVSAVDFEPDARRLRVTFDPRKVSPPVLGDALQSIGVPARLQRQTAALEGRRGRSWRQSRTELAVGLGGALIVLAWSMGVAGAAEWAVVACYALAIVVSGTVTWRRALLSLQARSIDMNVLMSIAVVGAVALGQWSEAAAVIWLFALGGLLESLSLARTRRSIRDLMNVAPPIARVRRGESVVEVAPDDVGLGETLMVRPGERIALDGMVRVGASAVDESPITGEAAPVDKQAGDTVYAGSLATTGLLEVEVTATANDTTLARIVYLVEEAQASKAPAQRLVDRFTRWYTPAVVVLSAAVALVPPFVGRILGLDVGTFGDWFYRGLVVLVVSCPCALVISTPVAIVSAISRAARDGVLVKGGAFLELAGHVKAMAFDKTGTLTRGLPMVAEVVAVDSDVAQEAILVYAAALEQHSTHPVARTLLRAADEGSEGIIVREFSDIPGIGLRGTIDGVLYEIGGSRLLGMFPEESAAEAIEAVAAQEAKGRTTLVLARDGVPIGVVGVADTVRAEAPQVTRELYELGVRHIVMLTGDNERTAEAVARTAGVGDVRARLLPQEKTDAVRDLQRRFGVVAMTGDGINDAPALAAADIGIAMGAAGSDTALETADVALMADDLCALPGFLRLSRRTVRIITENVAFSIAVKAITLVLAIAGIATLWLAVFADMGVALLVILNSMRLLRREGRRVSARNTVMVET